MEYSTKLQSPEGMKFTDDVRFSTCHREDYSDTVERSQLEDVTKQMRRVTQASNGGECAWLSYSDSRVMESKQTTTHEYM